MRFKNTEVGIMTNHLHDASRITREKGYVMVLILGHDNYLIKTSSRSGVYTILDQETHFDISKQQAKSSGNRSL